VDVTVFFATRKARLEAMFPMLRNAIHPDGAVWIAWPKKASGVASDVDEHVVRDLGLAAKLVDVKVCAIDEVWSGLKFVIRKADRPASGKRGV
jgi:hypothetical protein